MVRHRVVPGGVAQLVERHVRNVEVGGSSPLTSTKSPGHCVDGERTFRRDLIYVTCGRN